MHLTVADRVRTRVAGVAALYHRLVLLVGAPHTGKTAVLRELSLSEGWPLINVNLTLSGRLLDVGVRARALKAARLLGEELTRVQSAVVLLDNTEILFSKDLALDPLRVLQGLARSRTIVASWTGHAAEMQLSYATPEHSEYRRYPCGDLALIRTRGASPASSRGSST